MDFPNSKLKMELIIKSEEVLADVRSAGWLEQELHPELDRHRRHQMADICEADNVERVWRVLGVSVAEVRFAMLKVLRPMALLLPANVPERPEAWTFSFAVSPGTDALSLLKEKIHEYLVASVMAERCAVIIPEAAPVWRGRAVEALAALREASCPMGRARRPIWPM